MKLGTQHYLLYIIVSKWIKLKIIVICLNYVVCSDLRVLSVFCTFAYNVAQTWFVLHETWHAQLFAIYYYVEMLEIRIIVIC